jgi:hypothetical protein
VYRRVEDREAFVGIDVESVPLQVFEFNGIAQLYVTRREPRRDRYPDLEYLDRPRSPRS